MSLHGAPLGQVDASAEFLFLRGFFPLRLMDALAGFVVVVWVLVVVPVVSLDPKTSRFLLFPHDASV